MTYLHRRGRRGQETWWRPRRAGYAETRRSAAGRREAGRCCPSRGSGSWSAGRAGRLCPRRGRCAQASCRQRRATVSREQTAEEYQPRGISREQTAEGLIGGRCCRTRTPARRAPPSPWRTARSLRHRPACRGAADRRRRQTTGLGRLRRRRGRRECRRCALHEAAASVRPGPSYGLEASQKKVRWWVVGRWRMR